MSKLKVLELFSGIGACSKALERLGIEHEIVDAVEIDKYAVKSFNAVHGTNFEPQDITKWDKDIDVDLIMHGSPCQDFSVAGLGKGGDKGSGTRSSLMYETLRIVEKLKPKYVIWENVKNLLSKKHIHNFNAYLEAMEKLGYKNYYKVLNAKDYGIPQNRERVFTVSFIEREREYEWPSPMPLERKLKDMLDEAVDEKYYLSDRQMEGMINTSKGLVKPNDVIEYTFSKARLEEIENGGIRKQNKIDNSCMSTLKCHPQQLGVCVEDSIAIKTANKQGYDLAKDGDGIDLAYPKSTTRRGRVGHEVSKTLACSDTMGTLQNYRIRKLTPKEVWRLMGFDDSDFEKAEKVNSNSQLYKQAGNSIVVNVLEGILKNLLENEYGR